MADISSMLQAELDNYLNAKEKFEEYYPNMNILTSNLYKRQLENILKSLDQVQGDSSKNFKLYLDTVIVNMHTKISKYKKSPYFDTDEVKVIENQGYFIPFYIDKKNDKYVILAIIKNEP